MTNKEVIETLEAVRGAVADEKTQTAIDEILVLNELYSQARRNETTRRQRFLLVHNETGVSADDRVTFTEYVSTATSIQPQRADLLATAAKYASGIEISRDAFLDMIDEMKETESALLDKYEAAAEVEIPDSTRASVYILETSLDSAPVPKGKQRDIEITVGNAGDESASAVTLALSGTDEIQINSASIDVGEVTNQVSVSTQLSGDESGQFSVNAELSSSEAGTDFDSLQFAIVGKREVTQNAKTHVNNGIEKIDENKNGNRNGGNKAGHPLKKKLENANKKLNDALEFIENEKPKQANNMITAANRILDSFLNQLDSQRNKTSNPIYLEDQAKAAIDSIETAKEANI